MANRFDIKTKTFFQIPPNLDPNKASYSKNDNVVFMDYGFRLDDIHLITEPVMEWELKYTFAIHTGYSEDRKITFEFKRKQDCVMAQRELSRAWTRTGEFSYEEKDEDLAVGEGSDT